MIPQYGELNRIYRDYIDNYAFSFDRQKFISDFYQEYNDMKSFEAAILELVLDKQKEQYTLIFNSLKTEIEKSIQAYEIRPLSDRAIERACYQHMERYSQEIEAQLDVTRSLSKPLNEANNRYDSIGYREHTAEEEKQAEKEYERCKAEYDREKAKLNKLYDQQKATRTEAFQYMKNCCADIYRQSCLFLDILKKYIPDGKQENKSSEPISQQETTEEQQEKKGKHLCHAQRAGQRLNGDRAVIPRPAGRQSPLRPCGSSRPGSRCRQRSCHRRCGRCKGLSWRPPPRSPPRSWRR